MCCPPSPASRDATAQNCLIWPRPLFFSPRGAGVSRVRKKGSFGKGFFFQKDLEILEKPPDSGKQRRIRLFSRDSGKFRCFRDSRDFSSEKTPFVMTPSSGPELDRPQHDQIVGFDCGLGGPWGRKCYNGPTKKTVCLLWFAGWADSLGGKGREGVWAVGGGVVWGDTSLKWAQNQLKCSQKRNQNDLKMSLSHRTDKPKWAQNDLCPYRRA